MGESILLHTERPHTHHMLIVMYGKMPCITIQAKEICISDSLHQPIREQLGFISYEQIADKRSYSRLQL
ncbi:hypothetical protein VCHA54O485_150090 [Vibrio chagasii]|nr:hypothetical protein VCHA55P509_140090 [Vibrio chagasii]CAH6990688.1 hypothetical protein VCHA54O485_150090 [Vibrio chagasii]CAH7226741.1 hypothetical protein VCHA54P501_160028 [Vibrio chagasii]